MRLLLHVALRHLLFRKRQSLVSLFGIILGVAFFLAISSLMKGSENDFVRRLVDNSPHITVNDEFRASRVQPVETLYSQGAIELSNVKPLTEIRGIRGYKEALSFIRSIHGVEAAPVLEGQALVSFAGRDVAITLDGMNPEDVKGITTIEQYMREGSIDELIANPNGLLIGSELARTLALSRGDNISVAAPTGQVRTFKILGIFRTGRVDYDATHAFASLKRVQALLDRPHRINSIIIRLSDPWAAAVVADQIESRLGYKSVSWQEKSEDLLSTLKIRNTIMYTVVSAVLIVAAFGIYNVISTTVLEKHRDIAILKSMGFHAADVRAIFVLQGAILGGIGCLIGLPLGSLFMLGLMQIEFSIPWSSDPTRMPLDWGLPQFIIAAAFALCSAILAALLPARRGAALQPVDILRGRV